MLWHEMTECKRKRGIGREISPLNGANGNLDCEFRSSHHVSAPTEKDGFWGGIST